MSDFRFSLSAKASFLSRRKPLTQSEINLIKKVLDRISREGPLMARDFGDRVTKICGWWDGVHRSSPLSCYTSIED
jgi:uncharacterized protein YcaQ